MAQEFEPLGPLVAETDAVISWTSKDPVPQAGGCAPRAALGSAMYDSLALDEREGDDLCECSVLTTRCTPLQTMRYYPRTVLSAYCVPRNSHTQHAVRNTVHSLNR